MSAVKTAVVETQVTIPTATLTALPLPQTTPLSSMTLTPRFPTIAPVQKSATPTRIPLPFNEHSYEGEYCHSPSVKLSTSDAQGLSDDEIAGKLMDLWLAYFYNPQTPDWCRIDGYTVDKVYYDERTPYLPLEPKGDIMRVVQFL